MLTKRESYISYTYIKVLFLLGNCLFYHIILGTQFYPQFDCFLNSNLNHIHLHQHRKVDVNLFTKLWLRQFTVGLTHVHVHKMRLSYN